MTDDILQPLVDARIDGDLDDTAWAAAVAEHGEPLELAFRQTEAARAAVQALAKPALPPAVAMAIGSAIARTTATRDQADQAGQASADPPPAAPIPFVKPWHLAVTGLLAAGLVVMVTLQALRTEHPAASALDQIADSGQRVGSAEEAARSVDGAIVAQASDPAEATPTAIGSANPGTLRERQVNRLVAPAAAPTTEAPGASAAGERDFAAGLAVHAPASLDDSASDPAVDMLEDEAVASLMLRSQEPAAPAAPQPLDGAHRAARATAETADRHDQPTAASRGLGAEAGPADSAVRDEADAEDMIADGVSEADLARLAEDAAAFRRSHGDATPPPAEAEVIHAARELDPAPNTVSTAGRAGPSAAAHLRLIRLPGNQVVAQVAVTNTSDNTISDLAGTVVLEGFDAEQRLIWRSHLATPTGPLTTGGMSVWHQDLDASLGIPPSVVAVRIALGDAASDLVALSDAVTVDQIDRVTPSEPTEAASP